MIATWFLVVMLRTSPGGTFTIPMQSLDACQAARTHWAGNNWDTRCISTETGEQR